MTMEYLAIIGINQHIHIMIQTIKVICTLAVNIMISHSPFPHTQKQSALFPETVAPQSAPLC